MAGSACPGQKVKFTLGRSTTSTGIPSRVRGGQTTCQPETRLAGRAAPVQAAKRLPDVRRSLAVPPRTPLPRLVVSRRALRRKGRVDNNKPQGGRDPTLPSSGCLGSQCLGPRTRVPARSRGAGAAAAPDSRPSGPPGCAGRSAAGRRRLCRLAAPQGRLVAAAEARAAAEDGWEGRRLYCCRGRRRRYRVSAAPAPVWRRARRGPVGS